jgi:hypothetical protein
MSRCSAGWALGIAFGVIAAFAIADLATAQRVWVGEGGVSVRAPFVRVDVGPYGGVSVRAPFANIDVPPDYYYEPYPRFVAERFLEPAFPTANELAGMNDGQLYNALVSINERLQRRLDRFNTGQTWQRYLALPPVAMAAMVDPAFRRETLVALLEKFHRVSADPQFSMIASLPAFVAMQDALTEIVARPESGGPRPNALPDGGALEPEELPLPAPQQQPQQPIPPQQPQQQLPSPQSQQLQQPNPAQRDGPFLRPR